MYTHHRELSSCRSLALGLWGFCLALLVSACSTPQYQSFVEPIGGHDAEGAGDQLYFHTAFCEGHPSRLAALVLPDGWPDRERRVSSGDGIWRLVPPVEVRWVHGDAIVPAARLELVGGEGGASFHLRESSEAQSFPLWTHRDTDLHPEEIDAEALGRLRMGDNAYRVVPLDSKARLAPHRVLGAVLDGEGGIEWVELAVLDFDDSRGFPTRIGHGAARWGSDVLAGTAILAAIGGGVWLTVAFLELWID